MCCIRLTLVGQDTLWVQEILMNSTIPFSSIYSPPCLDTDPFDFNFYAYIQHYKEEVWNGNPMR